MNLTYLLLNSVAMALLVPFLGRIRKPSRRLITTILTILALTAIFDPIIIAAGIVDYDTSKILGLYWFGAPVEDFFYALMAPMVIAVLWRRIGSR